MNNQRLAQALAKPSLRRRALDVLALAVAGALGVVAFAAVAQAPLTVGPARLWVALSPAWSPRTVVELPPFGRVSAQTHLGPVTLRVRLNEIDVAGARRMIERGELAIPEMLDADTAADLPVPGFSAALRRILGGGIVVAGVAGALVGLALRRGRAIVAACVVLALAVPSMAVGVAYATWDAGAFREPTLEGGLAYAPQLIDVFSTRVATIQRLREQAAKVARDVAAYYADERSLGSGGAMSGTYRVLHVTDLHLDPVGAELARQIARSYETSLVIDTGDLPILGAPVESGTFASLIVTSVPKVYVPGNHDSPASIAELTRLGVTVPTTSAVDVDGLRIFAVPDPFSRGFGVEPDNEVIEQAARVSADRLRESLAAGEPTPTVIGIHNPAMESEFVGLAPVLLSGHTHRARLYSSEGTVRLNSGTLGGMPYDPEASGRRALPYSASVLYFTAEMPRRLIAVDRISVFANRSTTVSRDVVDDTLLP